MDNRKAVMTLAGLMSEGDRISCYSAGYYEYFFIASEGGDTAGDLENTLYRLSGICSDDEIRYISGMRQAGSDDDENTIYPVDRNYVIDIPESITPTGYTYIKWHAYEQYVMELLKEAAGTKYDLRKLVSSFAAAKKKGEGRGFAEYVIDSCPFIKEYGEFAATDYTDPCIVRRLLSDREKEIYAEDLYGKRPGGRLGAKNLMTFVKKSGRGDLSASIPDVAEAYIYEPLTDRYIREGDMQELIRQDRKYTALYLDFLKEKGLSCGRAREKLAGGMASSGRYAELFKRVSRGRKIGTGIPPSGGDISVQDTVYGRYVINYMSGYAGITFMEFARSVDTLFGRDGSPEKAGRFAEDCCRNIRAAENVLCRDYAAYFDREYLNRRGVMEYTDAGLMKAYAEDAFRGQLLSEKEAGKKVRKILAGNLLDTFVVKDRNGDRVYINEPYEDIFVSSEEMAKIIMLVPEKELKALAV